MFAAHLRDGLELRLLEERDACEHFALVDRDRLYLRPWFSWVDATHSEADSLAFIRDARERFANMGEITAGIWVNNEYAGCLGTHLTNLRNHRTEIGYWLGKSFQGRGIMTE